MNDTTFQGNGSVKYVPVVVNAKPKPITNADEIRASSDEELAAFIVRCVEADFFRVNVLGAHSNSAEEWLDWLRQEVDDDNNS